MWDNFNHFFYVGIYVDPVDEFKCQQMCFSMPMWVKCSWFNALFCINASTIILPPFMPIASMIAVLSLSDQYGCNFFCTSAFVMVSHAVHILTASYHLDVPALFLLLACHLIYLCMTLLHLWLCTYFVFPHLCLSHGFIWISSVL